MPPRHVIEATHECAFHEKSSHYLVSDCSFFGVHVDQCDQLRARIRNIFKLLPSARFVITYSDITSMNQFEELRDSGILRDSVIAPSQSPLRVKVVHKCSNPTVRVVQGDSFYLMTPHAHAAEDPGCQPAGVYEQFHGRVRVHFRIPSSTQFVLIYRDPKFSEQYMTVNNDEDLEVAMEQASPNNLLLAIRITEGDEDIKVSSPIAENPPYIMKAMHDGVLRRLTLARVGFSLAEFRSRIRVLFFLPPSAQLMLSYTDEAEHSITMTGDNDLAMALQSLHPVRVDVIWE